MWQMLQRMLKGFKQCVLDFCNISLENVLDELAGMCDFDSFDCMPNDLHVCRLKVISASSLVLCPDFITSSFQCSLIRIPTGQRSRTSSSPAKGAHLSERHGDHRPTNLPCLPDCQALCLHIKDKRTEPESERAEQPFYLEMVHRLNPQSVPFENAYQPG